MTTYKHPFHVAEKTRRVNHCQICGASTVNRWNCATCLDRLGTINNLDAIMAADEGHHYRLTHKAKA